MDYKELIEQLRKWDEDYVSEMCADDVFDCHDLCDKKDCIVIRVTDAIETLLAERESKHGKWEHHLMPLALKCSRCKRVVSWKSKIDYNYCPYCGAKMDLTRGPTPPDRERTER